MPMLFSRGIFLIAFTFLALNLQAQFDLSRLELRLGYNLHNAPAKRFNHLIDSYNDTRYPLLISKKLSRINFLHGIEFGANYEMTDDIRLYTLFRNRHQFIEAPSALNEMWRQFMFRSNSMETGISYVFEREKHFTHMAGGGIFLGVLSAYTGQSTTSGYKGAGDMLDIAHSFQLGIGIHYEARYMLNDHIGFYIRPNMILAFHSNISHLNDFFNPQETDGEIRYFATESDKYNKGGLNGMGISGGLLLKMPEW